MPPSTLSAAEEARLEAVFNAFATRTAVSDKLYTNPNATAAANTNASNSSNSSNSTSGSSTSPQHAHTHGSSLSPGGSSTGGGDSDSHSSTSGSQYVYHMNGAKFAKLCRDAQLFAKPLAPRTSSSSSNGGGSSSSSNGGASRRRPERQLTSTDADLVFAKVTTHARRTLSFSAFRREALPALAEKKRVEPDLLLRHVCKHAGRGPAYGGSSSTSGGAASQP